MPKDITFTHQTRGPGRPQIVLFGNGLERKSNQPDWNTLIQKITVENCTELTEDQKKNIPFPLLYVLLSTPVPVPSALSRNDLVQEERRLTAALRTLKNENNEFLDRLPFLEADHIFTTNYSYCMENAFYHGKDFSRVNVRSAYRFNLNPQQKNGKPVRESNYRLHSGYFARNAGGTNVGLWHIHGERSAARSVVLGHDRYGRLLSRMESICSGQAYKGEETQSISRNFTSWPELFLYGDVYVVGFGFWECEFDLWWLLRRKQRERYGDGKVFFYDRNQDMDVRKKLLSVHGVEMCCTGIYGDSEFDRFYLDALEDIKCRIQKRRGEKDTKNLHI